MRQAIVALAVIFAVGCGGAGSPNGALDGNSPFEVGSGIAWRGGDQAVADERTFALSKDAYTCEQARTSDGFTPANSLFSQVVAGTIAAPTLSLGHYPNDAGGSVEMYIQQAQGTNIELHLTSGTVDVEALEPNFKGTFTTQIDFDDGGSQTISGSFDTPYCQP